MKEEIIQVIANLFKIKSIVTITTTIAFVVLALRGTIGAEQFLTIFTVIIGFYFGTQKVKETEDITVKDEAESEVLPVQVQYDAVYESDTAEPTK